MVILKTIVGNLLANVNEITFTDATINSNSIIEVYYNSNDIYTVETWQRENTIGIVTSDHDFPVSVKVLINNVVAFEPYDDSELLSRLSGDEDDITALDGRLDTAEDNITSLDGRLDIVEGALPNKQNVLTAGDNIIIENNVISASGGGVDYSLDEQDTGLKWIDGKPIYQKTINFGALPNRTTKSVNHSISNVTPSNFVYFNAFATYPDGYMMPVPKVHDRVPQGGSQCFFEISATDIKCYSREADLSAYTECYITLRYTKTTD